MKKVTLLSIIVMFLVLAITPTLAAPLGQGEGQEYIVQADDTLKKIAEKFYGDPLAWPGIWEATNVKAGEDSSFATIEDPDVIDAGQKLWLPPADEAGQLVSIATEKLLVDVTAMFKISETGGNFGALVDEDSMGPVTSMGDIDGDGVDDLAAGAPYNLRSTDAWTKFGAAWTILLNADGTVKGRHRIDQNDLPGLVGADAFGISVTSADFNLDGRPEFVVGAAGDNGRSNDEGAVWILFLNPDGSLGASLRIGSGSPGLENALDHGDVFGVSVANLGDMDGDGVPDLAVGAPKDDNGQGAVWVLFMNTNAGIKSAQKISATTGGFSGELAEGDNFGSGLANLGDLNEDGVIDLAVGAAFDDDGGSDQGAVWILFLNSDGTVSDSQKISATSGGFTDVLEVEGGFGVALAGVGDLNDDGVPDLAASAPGDDGSGAEQGAIWMLYLNRDGTVSLYQKIGPTTAGFDAPVYDNDNFGAGLAALDGEYNLAIGVPGSDDGGINKGAIWLVSLK